MDQGISANGTFSIETAPASGVGTLKSLAVALLIGLAAVGLNANSARAVVILNVVGGQLLGAQNVDVDGTLYDVEFVEGSCIDIFDGCDADSDFDFDANGVASMAARAVLDQVLLDSSAGLFDSRPELTYGCGDSFSCTALIPNSFIGELPGVINIGAPNLASPGDQLLAIVIEGRARDLGLDETKTYARFRLSETGETSLPEPATLLLFGVALSGLAAARRRRAA